MPGSGSAQRRGRGILTITVDGVAGIGPHSLVVASASEVDAHGEPAIGIAGIEVYSVAPKWNGAVVQVNTNWEPHDITVRVSIVSP